MMINFRKIKQDFSPGILKEGRQLFEQDAVIEAKVVSLDGSSIRINGKVLGNFDNTYECELELERGESEATDSNCDCPYTYDCQHLAALVFYLEKKLDELVVAYSKETDLEACDAIDEEEKEELRKAFEQAQTKEAKRKGKEFRKELLQEYTGASQLLGTSPFCLPDEELEVDKAELAIILVSPEEGQTMPPMIQLALRLPYRSKPLNIPNVREFLECVHYKEPLYLNSKRYFFTRNSFPTECRDIFELLISSVRFPPVKSERALRMAPLDPEGFGILLAKAYKLAVSRGIHGSIEGAPPKEEAPPMPFLYVGGLEQPLRASRQPANLHFMLELLESPAPKLFLKPMLSTGADLPWAPEEVQLFECARPGMIQGHTYYRFPKQIKRKHLKNLEAIRNVIIPEPLFGTFVENTLPELLNYAEVDGQDQLERFVTLPHVDELEACCDINYLNGELDARLSFLYAEIQVPAADSQVSVEQVEEFISPQGILARNLVEEQAILSDLFQGFTYDAEQGIYCAKTDKKIVEFMTEVVPRNQYRVQFQCPENLLDRFIYDETTFRLSLKQSSRIDMYELDLKVDGHLEGVTLDLLWECLSSKKAFIELERKKSRTRGTSSSRLPKILVLDLEILAPVVQIFDELGIKSLETHVEQRPLWSLANITESLFEELPIQFSISEGLIEVQKQMLGHSPLKPTAVPRTVNAKLRAYQREGVQWLERLRRMHLSGILADDMGLGKTLQAITAISQQKREHKEALSLIVCPTSLTYNWKEEFHKFNPKLAVLLVDGTPAQRKKLLKTVPDYDVIITSYSLLQKDVDIYKGFSFHYAILDEAQHIKNRGTRNAKSVKQIQAAHRLILTGTPIENSLEELWSLFDFLMPGLLSSFDRFVEKYLRNPSFETGKNLEALRKKVSPFILRRMKTEVLKDLPPVSQIVYHCHLSEMQRELYRSYALSAREELSKLVQKEGFDKVQIHVLATLTRLKQICCHPAIFAKDRPDHGDSAKYDMLIELLEGLIDGKHKTVIFSQYTRMLRIMREDLAQRGIRFCYLDGSSKNRLDIVKEFNEDADIPVFLVSLKAGGSGLNLTGADTVIHYDMWWNPAVENQATDRVHRIGQKNAVSSYKFVTLGTIEEKILELQNRKRGQVTKVVNCDEEAMSKLTWEEVLELLQA